MNITKINKTANIPEEKIPSVDILASYVESLKTYESDHSELNPKISYAIKNLPSVSSIKNDTSKTELKILFETISWAWKKITGKDIVETQELPKNKETLFGNYWLINNGILLHGVNHYGIVKQHPNIFSSLLKLNGFALQQYLLSQPEKLIKYIIQNGGIRLFINDQKQLYAQMSQETYSKWGKTKINNLDFHKKIIRVIDINQEYEGWESGIPIILR